MHGESNLSGFGAQPQSCSVPFPLAYMMEVAGGPSGRENTDACL